MENTHLITVDIGGGRTELIKSSDAKGVDTMLALRNNTFITHVPMINVMVSTEGVRLDRTRMVIQKIKDNLQKIPDGYLRVGTLRVCEASPGFWRRPKKDTTKKTIGLLPVIRILTDGIHMKLPPKDKRGFFKTLMMKFRCQIATSTGS